MNWPQVFSRFHLRQLKRHSLGGLEALFLRASVSIEALYKTAKQRSDLFGLPGIFFMRVKGGQGLQ
ncbi:MAG: hypothetical protein ACJAQT_004697 [Akkermansiaceae bacterium]|jgi:hypothetical protein